MTKIFKYIIDIICNCMFVIGCVYACITLHIPLYRLIFNKIYMLLFVVIFLFFVCFFKIFEKSTYNSVKYSLLIWELLSGQFLLIDYFAYIIVLETVIILLYMIFYFIGLRKSHNNKK